MFILTVQQTLTSFHQTHHHHQPTDKTTCITSSNLVLTLTLSRYYCYCFLDEETGLWELKSLAMFMTVKWRSWDMGMYLSDQSGAVLLCAKWPFPRKHWKLVPTSLATKERRERWSVKRTVISQELLRNLGFQSQYGGSRALWFKAWAPWVRQPSLTIAARHWPAAALGQVKTL